MQTTVAAARPGLQTPFHCSEHGSQKYSDTKDLNRILEIMGVIEED